MADSSGGRGGGGRGGQSRRGGGVRGGGHHHHRGRGGGGSGGGGGSSGDPPNPNERLDPPPNSEIEEDKKVEKECYVVMPEGSMDMSNVTIVVKNEGHTIGNLLRTVIGSYPEVRFVGHTIPHPSENELHVRIQVETGHDAQEVFVRALKDIMELCDHTEDVFSKAVEEYKNDPAHKDELLFVSPAPKT